MPNVDWQENGLLALLPGEVRERLGRALESTVLDFNRVLYRPGEPLRHVYFPLEGIVCDLHISADGAATSVGLIGREGMVGLSSFLGGLEATTEARVIAPGRGLRLDVHVLEREFERGDEFQKTMLLFAQAFIAQTGQIAVCNRHHSLDQQLCFWLLLCLERVPSNEIRITQEMLAELLGVRREGITRAALKLKHEGLLAYRRGRVTVLGRPRIQQLACECYHIVSSVYASLLGAQPAEQPDTEASAAADDIQADTAHLG